MRDMFSGEIDGEDLDFILWAAMRGRGKAQNGHWHEGHRRPHYKWEGSFAGAGRGSQFTFAGTKWEWVDAEEDDAEDHNYDYRGRRYGQSTYAGSAGGFASSASYSFSGHAGAASVCPETRAHLRSLDIDSVPASMAELRSVYTVAAKRYHPDMVSSGVASAQRFQASTEAFQFLRARLS